MALFEGKLGIINYVKSSFNFPVFFFFLVRVVLLFKMRISRALLLSVVTGPQSQSDLFNDVQLSHFITTFMNVHDKTEGSVFFNKFKRFAEKLPSKISHSLYFGIITTGKEVFSFILYINILVF